MIRSPATTIATATTSAVIESKAASPVIWTRTRPTSTPAEVSASVRRWAASPSSAGESCALRLAREDRRDAEVGDHREAHHGDADAERLDLGADDEPVGRLVDDDPGADQDQHPLDRRRQVLDLLVAVGMLGVGRLVGFADRDEGDHRGDQVDQRVDRLGEDRDRAGDRPGGELERDQQRVGGDRERRRAALGADHRALRPRRQAEVRGEHARGAAAVADRVLLRRRSARTSCARRRARCRRGRRPGRSRSRPRRAARSISVPSQRASKTCSVPSSSIRASAQT